jgi:hypothetical protein
MYDVGSFPSGNEQPRQQRIEEEGHVRFYIVASHRLLGNLEAVTKLTGDNALWLRVRVLRCSRRVLLFELHTLTGHTWSKFSLSGTLLVTRGAYSLSLSFYWSHIEHILTLWHSIGHTRKFFSAKKPVIRIVLRLLKYQA